LFLKSGINRDSVVQPTVAAGIKSARPARIALQSRMAGVVADSTLTLFCFLIFDLDIEVELAYFNNCLYNIFST